MLTKLIEPLSIKDFVTRFQSQRAYHSVGQLKRFSKLFQWTDIEHCLSNCRVGDPAIRLIEEHIVMPFDSISQMREHISKGKTIVIDNLQEVDPVIRTFCETLSLELNVNVNINCYASHPNAQGFALHYDLHDVFIIQTEGVKRWQVYGGDELLPTSCSNQDSAPPHDVPYMDIELQPGEVLYIPRGHWHKATAIESCVHLTLTVPPSTGTAMLKGLIDQLSTSNSVLRQELPLYDIASLGGNQSEEQLDQQLEDITQVIIETLSDPALVKQYLIDHVMSQGSHQNDITLPQMGLLSTDFKETTKLSRQIGKKCLIRQISASSAKVVTFGQELVIHNMPVPVIKTMLSDDKVVTGAMLIEQSKNENTPLAWEHLKDILTTLVNKGFLRLC